MVLRVHCLAYRALLVCIRGDSSVTVTVSVAAPGLSVDDHVETLLNC
jgi:hypothetical protein